MTKIQVQSRSTAISSIANIAPERSYAATPSSLLLNYVINGYFFPYILDSAPNVFYEPSSNTHPYATADKEPRVLILADLLEFKTILQYHVIELPKRILEGIISDI